MFWKDVSNVKFCNKQWKCNIWRVYKLLWPPRSVSETHHNPLLYNDAPDALMLFLFLPLFITTNPIFLNPMKIIFKNLTHLIGKKKLFRFEKAMSMIWWNFKLYLCVGFLPLKESRWSSWPWKIPALMVGVQFSCWSNVQHTHHNATLSNQHRTNTQFYVICSKHLSAAQWPL